MEEKWEVKTTGEAAGAEHGPLKREYPDQVLTGVEKRPSAALRCMPHRPEYVMACLFSLAFREPYLRPLLNSLEDGYDGRNGLPKSLRSIRIAFEPA